MPRRTAGLHGGSHEHREQRVDGRGGLQGLGRLSQGLAGVLGSSRAQVAGRLHLHLLRGVSRGSRALGPGGGGEPLPRGMRS